jgi:hypothetical protein
MPFTKHIQRGQQAGPLCALWADQDRTRILEADSRGNAEREHLLTTCRVCGVQVDEADSTTALMRKLIMHLAAQEPIVIAPDEEA